MLKLLQEASTLSMPDIKKAMSKDKQASLIFKKDLTLDKIDNVESFLSSIKYYLLNNDNIHSFIKSRNNIKDVDTSYLASVRKMRAEKFNQEELDHLKQFVSDLFKEYKTVSNGTMSSDLKKEITKWVNSNSSYFNFTHWAQKELQSLPAIRPTKKVVLYRGVLFSEYSLKSKIDTYDGSLEEGNGAKFLKSIRDDNRTVDLTWDRASSWTSDKSVAEQFAKYGAASSQFGAMLQWFDRNKSKKFIDGSLGYVISTLADPADILIDMNMMSASIHSAHGNESEVIMNPGTYLCRVVRKFTVEGEVDPDTVPSVENIDNIKGALELLDTFVKEIKLPDEVELSYMGYHGSASILSNDNLKKLILNSSTTIATHYLDKFLGFYRKHLNDIPDSDLRADRFSDPIIARRASALKDLIREFKSPIVHAKFKDNPKSKGKTHELSAEEIRKNFNNADIEYLEQNLLVKGIITSDAAARLLVELGRVLDVPLPAAHVIVRMGNAKQSELIKKVLDKFYNKVGVYEPADKHESIKTMINLLKKANRNNATLNFINKIYKSMEQVNA
jgi:hypothetical protein